ncbi:MAG: HAMP domain-containing sensor histidine kinase [Ignavibacteriaceae bacterium]|jgi:signal transduction histidine kinase
MDNKNKIFVQQKIFAETSGTTSHQIQNRGKQSNESFVQKEAINIAGSLVQSDFNATSVSEGNTLFEYINLKEKLSTLNSYSFLNSKSSTKHEWYSTGLREIALTNFHNDLSIGLEPNMFVFESSMEVPYSAYYKRYRETFEISESGRDIPGDEMQSIFSPLDQNLEEIAWEYNKLKETLLLTQNENIRLKELNKSKNGLISIISHDLKNPFGALLNMSEFLATDFDDMEKEEVCDFAKTINISAKILYKFFNDLLEWSKLQSDLVTVHPVEIELSTAVNDIVTLLNIIAVPKGITLINKTTPQLKLNADLNMLSSILNNLITNAIKFTKTGDTVVIESEEVNGFVRITVKDTGIGIGKNILEKIFSVDKHITNSGTENEIGSGLGLVITKELITRQGGSLWVESVEGEGTTFYFTLPKAKLFSEVA